MRRYRWIAVLLIFSFFMTDACIRAEMFEEAEAETMAVVEPWTDAEDTLVSSGPDELRSGEPDGNWVPEGMPLIVDELS